jgi:hypothetical protein
MSRLPSTLAEMQIRQSCWSNIAAGDLGDTL